MSYTKKAGLESEGKSRGNSKKKIIIIKMVKNFYYRNTVPNLMWTGADYWNPTGVEYFTRKLMVGQKL